VFALLPSYNMNTSNKNTTVNTSNTVNIVNWLDRKVSLYSTHADNMGRPATFRDVLLSEFGRDLKTIIQIRELDKSAPDFDCTRKALKAKLQCYTPAALLSTKAKGQLQEIERTGIMQLDFDAKDIHQYDVEELKQAIFDLPFIGFCGLSCGGDGFYALALIAEPERLSDYAEHCFQVLEEYGVKPDTSKGKKPENLRYVSYDCNMLIRESPEPLRITQFKTKPKTVYSPSASPVSDNPSRLIQSVLNSLRFAQRGQRWETVQKAAYTLGGIGDLALLDQIKSIIHTNLEFSGLEAKYAKCAQDCFNAGLKRPLTQNHQHAH
jgi:hypothetical protein